MEFFGEMAALAASILWSFTGFVFSSAANRVGATTVNISRLISASLILSVIVSIGYLSGNISINLSGDQIFYLIMSGVIGLSIGDQFLFKSYEQIGPRYGMLLLSSSPVLSALLGFTILGESMSAPGVAGMLVAMGGIALVVLEDTADGTVKFKMTRKGLIFGLLAAVGQAVGMIFSKAAFNSGELHWMVGSLGRILSAGVFLFPVVIVTKGFGMFGVFAEDRKSLGLVVLGSVIGPVLGITSSFIAIKYTIVGVAATLTSLSPVMMLPLSAVLHKEKLSWKAVVGAFLAVGGVTLLFLFE